MASSIDKPLLYAISSLASTLHCFGVLFGPISSPSLPLLPACHPRLHTVISRPTHFSPCLLARVTRPPSTDTILYFRLSTLTNRFRLYQGGFFIPTSSRHRRDCARVSLLQQRLQPIPPQHQHQPALEPIRRLWCRVVACARPHICLPGKHRDFLMFLMTRMRVFVKTSAPRLAPESRDLPLHAAGCL